MRSFLVLYFSFNLILSAFYIDVWINANTTSRALPIISYFESGTFQIDKYHEKTCDKAYVNGHYYTDKAPLPTYMVLPFFGILKSLGLITPDQNGSLFGSHIFILGGFLIASLPFALLMLMVFKRLRQPNYTVSPVLLSMLPFYSSFIFLFAGTFFAHIMSGMFLTFAYISYKHESHLLSGMFAGLSFLCEFNLAVIFFIWGLLLIFRLRRIKPAVIFAAGILPSVIFILIYNYTFTGSPFAMLYKFHNFEEVHTGYGFAAPSLKSVWGLSLSWYKGLLFYSPFLVLVLVAALKKFEPGKMRSFISHPLVLGNAVYFFFISSYFAWWGGWTQGPRFLLAPAMLLTFEGILFVAKQKIPVILFWLLTFFGLAITFLSKITVVYSVPTDISNPMTDLVIPHVVSGKFNENNILTMMTGTNPAFSAVIFFALFAATVIGLELWHRRLRRIGDFQPVNRSESYFY
jgi:hypothetical protein